MYKTTQVTGLWGVLCQTYQPRNNPIFTQFQTNETIQLYCNFQSLCAANCRMHIFFILMSGPLASSFEMSVVFGRRMYCRMNSGIPQVQQIVIYESLSNLTSNSYSASSAICNTNVLNKGLIFYNQQG